jgi:polysaccharide export outer membrane protein
VNRRLISALALAVFGSACASRPPVVAHTLQSPVVAHQTERLDPALLDDAIGGADGEAYKVGPGDTLVVAVYGHPELSIAPYVGTLTLTNGRLAGLVIDNDGSIQFPLLGAMKVAGRTSAELQQYLEQELGTYVKDPHVTVQVVFAGSIRYYLLGQFTDPGMKFSDRPVRLLEALSLGGSINLDRASLATAYVARGKRRLPIDFRRLMLDGDLRQNIKLRSGDVVFVPDKSSEQAFVFGAAAGANSRGTVVPFMNGRLNLLQALAAAGYGYRDNAQGALDDTRVIRSEGDHGEVFTVDAERMLAGKVGPFELSPGDVVFVPPTGLTNWNEGLAQLLPSLETISGLLTPFVQIKYLSQK